MTIEDIRELVASDETRTLELKKTTGELKNGMHTACAFLNSDGGWLIFGVESKSLNIIGQQVTDNTRREIAQALSGLEPTEYVSVEYIEVPDRRGYQVIAMYFGGWKIGKKPSTYQGRPYYKVESTTKIMPREMYDDRIRAYRPNHYAWESQLADNVDIADLDRDRIQGCIRLGAEGGRVPASALSDPIELVLSQWRLLTDSKPNNAAALLFSKKVSHYMQFRLRMARFVGTDKNEFYDNQRVEGNFFELLDAGMAFCFKHLSLSGKIVELKREEHLEIPYPALREALINALCHRHWEDYNLTNSIAIFDDRIEISSPGKLPPQITPETIKLPHNSFPYNPIIAETLYKSTFLENWGSGGKRIIDACQDRGLEIPIWHEESGFVTIIFKRPMFSATKSEGINEGRSEGINLTIRQQRILDIIKENPTVNIAEIAIMIGVSVSTIEREMSKMSTYLRHTGSKKRGTWVLVNLSEK